MSNKTTLSDYWNEMNFGAYLAIQRVLEKPEWEKVRENIRLDTNSFQLLCHFYTSRIGLAEVGVGEILDLGYGALDGFKSFKDTGIIEKHDNKFILSEIGFKFGVAIESELRRTDEEAKKDNRSGLVRLTLESYRRN